MSWLSDFFSGGKNPADAAMPYLDKIPGMEHQAYDPYIGYGKDAASILNPQYAAMGKDPVAFLENIMKGYQPSKSYQLKEEEASRAAGNTAAAGGMRGSLSDIKNQARIADSLLGEDMQQWLNNVMGIQKEGMGGLSHLFDTGFDATKGLTGDLANVLGTQASLAFQGQANQNQSRNDLISGLLKALGGVAGFQLPGGGTIGGNLYNKFF